tara:strand:- start:546 stop:1562 length:1017 start_codon:yes stop_codon:yes gene_type:complete
MNNLISKDEKFLVAGGTGMVGKSIIKILLKNGYGDKKENGIIYHPSREELNLKNFQAVKEWFEIHKPTIVIMAAAKVGGILANSSFPSSFLLDNLIIQSNIIEISRISHVKRLIFLGSSCIYPKFSEQPIKEESLLSGPLETTNQWYAIAKIAGIKLCEAMRIQYGFDAICLMPTNLYGPGDNYAKDSSHVLAALIRRFYEAKENTIKEVFCWGSGEALREFMHVDDLGEAILFVLKNWNPDLKNTLIDSNGNKLNFLNVGTQEEISIKGLAELIAQKVGYEGDIRWDLTKPDGTPRKLLNSERLQKMGWEPKIKLKDGISKTIEEFKLKYLSGELKL